MRRAAVVLIAITLATACGFGTGSSIDAGAPRDATSIDADAFQCVHVQLDAGFGEACSGDQTALCHGDLGWCIGGVCRPQCVQPLACLACEGTAEHVSEAGLCYCAP